MPHSTITSKGQTTLPAQVRKALHLKTGDHITYEIHGDSVIIRPQPAAMEVFGSLKPSKEKTGVPFSAARQEAHKLWAKEGASEGLR